MYSKRILEQMSYLTLVLLLLAGCGGVPAAVATTPVPCPSVAPVSTVAEKLIPFQVIKRDKIRNQSGGMNWGDATTERGFTFFVVFFKGFQNDKGVSAQDMDWILRDERCSEFKPIGFGMPVLNEPVILAGVLSEGSISPESDATDPLLALIFVAPMKTKSVSIVSSQMQEYNLSVSSDWLPKPENTVGALTFVSEGRIDAIANGDNWTTSR